MRKVEDITGNGNSATWKANDSDWACLIGTFDGANVTLEGSPDGSNYISMGDKGVFTASGWVAINLPPTVQMRAVTTNAGSSTNIALHVG